MKQILQSLGAGETRLADVPCPGGRSGHLLIRSRTSLISAGTERMLLKFGRANLIEKVRQQPEKVRAVLDKVGTDGLLTTIEAVRSKLDQPLPLGYCNAGVVIEVGAGVDGFSPGDRVLSNGGHAEVVCVPKNLCARIPLQVTDEAAPFAVPAAIGLQGIRLAQPTLGETFVVTGLGLIGLLTVQLLRANGCRVLGIDFEAVKLGLARRYGAETVDLSAGDDPLGAAQRFSNGRGVDGVLITASTDSNEPMHQSAQMCRQRGRIVLVGTTGLKLTRADFYAKELSFQVSCSYGPGRYDQDYEQHGHDYPLAFVRWTEQRNFAAVLDLIAAADLDVTSLISHRFDITEAETAYETLASDKSALGIILKYPTESARPLQAVTETTVALPQQSSERPAGAPVVSAIGAGNYASRILLPAFRKAGAEFELIASTGGVSARHFGAKFGFRAATTDPAHIMADPRTNVVLIATRHDTHAPLVLEALRAGKHIFVEKPLCLTIEDLEAIRAAHRPDRCLMVGFNRRFAPHIRKIEQLLAGLAEPKTFIMTVNAGEIPPDHWTQDPQVGGGRIVGEACHFVDLLRFLAGSPIVGRQVTRIGEAPAGSVQDDKMTVTLSFADGSFGTIHYLANGHSSFPKERLEIFSGGRILQLDNFRVLRAYGWPGFRRMALWRQDKGQDACAAAFVEAVRHGSPAPIPFEEIVEVSRETIELANASLGTRACRPGAHDRQDGE